MIDSGKVATADDLKWRADASVPSGSNLPDVVQSGSRGGHDSECLTLEPQSKESSAYKHMPRDINLADGRNPAFIVSKKHLDVAEIPDAIDTPEGPHHNGLKSEGDAESDDSDAAAEKEEMATQKSLMEMYQTLLTGSASYGSSHDDVKYFVCLVIKKAQKSSIRN